MQGVKARPVALTMNYLKHAHASCLVEFGHTRVLVSAMAERSVPLFREGIGGWITAEYAMLPGSTPQRKQRDGIRKDGRGIEISRLVGRSLRAGFDLAAIDGWTITVDCDVMDADGGTRTAAITGGYCAVADLLQKMVDRGELSSMPAHQNIAAVSVGLVEGRYELDLSYELDHRADVDMNVVIKRGEGYIEVQGTGERAPFTTGQLLTMLEIARDHIQTLFRLQEEALSPKPKESKKILIASNNQAKIREIKAILEDYYDCFLTPQDFGVAFQVTEDGDTFEANAVKKAEAARDQFRMDALSDDSGLCVDALGGDPGVYSARYAGEEASDEENNTKLLTALQGIPEKERKAKFVSVIALARMDGETVVTRGESEGCILTEPRGSGGFGYDPLFYDDIFQKTYSEMTAEEKNAVSHRNRGLLLMRQELERL